MAINFGFFPSLNNDRTYDGYDLGGIFEGIITDGIFRNVGQSMEVVKYSVPFSIIVNPGKGWFEKTFIEVTNPVSIKFPESGTYYVIIEHDKDYRMNRLAYSKTLPTSANYMPLARVSVPVDGNITQSMITNLRGTSQCPFITGPLETLSADDILRQWQAEFNEFLTASEKSFKNFIEKTAPVELKKRVEELWLVLKTQYQNQWNNWYNTNTSDFKNQWNNWYNTNTSDFKNQWNNWYNTNTSVFKNQWNNWYNTNTSDFKNQWNNWYNTNTSDFKNKMDTFESSWLEWWHNMTYGKEEELKTFWDERKETLTSLMIKQWFEWYHPFVEEKEAEFTNWKVLYDQKTDQVENDYQKFNILVNDETTKVINTTNDGIEDIKKSIDAFHKYITSIGIQSIPFTSKITDSDDDLILDSDSDPILSINYLLVL